MNPTRHAEQYGELPGRITRKQVVQSFTDLRSLDVKTMSGSHTMRPGGFAEHTRVGAAVVAKDALGAANAVRDLVNAVPIPTSLANFLDEESCLFHWGQP